MKAVRLKGLMEVAIEDVPLRLPTPGEVVVQVTAAGMCGSDRHIVSGDYPSMPPVTLGHEVEGVVVGGAPSSAVGTGTRVAVDPNISCLLCRYCRAGLFTHCAQLSAIGVDRDGGLAEMLVVPERQVYVLPAGLPSGFGALCEPLACCLRAMDHAEVKPGYSAVVLGGGVIGQLLAQLARLAGARVILATRQREKRDLAEALGAAASVDPSAVDLVNAVAGPSGLSPGGVDVAFEAAGVAETFPLALGSVRRGGTVVVVGAAPKYARVDVSPFDIFERELRVVGSHLNPLTHGRAVELAASGQLSLASLVTRTVGLDEVPGLLTSAPDRGEIKVHVVPSE